MSKKVMKLIDPRLGLMECRICGYYHIAILRSGGFYMRGSWQCANGCRFEDLSLDEIADLKEAERSGK